MIAFVCATTTAHFVPGPDPGLLARIAEAVTGYAPAASFSVRNDGALYMSRFNERCEDDGCHDLLHVHEGQFFQGSRRSLSPLVLWLANSRRLTVYSIEYRLASQGASFSDMLDDVRDGIAWLRAR